MFGLRSPTGPFALLTRSDASAMPLQAAVSPEALSTDIYIAAGILVAAVVAAAVYAKQRANILTVGLILAYVFVVRAETSISEMAEVAAAWAIYLSPVGTVVGAIIAAAVVAALSSLAERTRTVMFGGAVAFLFALLAGDALLAVLIERGMIGDATLRPYGWSRRAGLQLGIAVGILFVVAPVVIQATSYIWQHLTSTNVSAKSEHEESTGEQREVDDKEGSGREQVEAAESDSTAPSDASSS